MRLTTLQPDYQGLQPKRLGKALRAITGILIVIPESSAISMPANEPVSVEIAHARA